MSSGSLLAPSILTSHSTLDLLLEEHSSTHSLPLPPEERTLSPSLTRSRKLIRTLCWLCGVGIILIFTLTILGSHGKQAIIGYPAHDRAAHQIIDKENLLRDHPSPIMVTDRRGRSRWTISTIPDLEFPLRPKQYVEICSGSMEMAKRLDELKSHTTHNHVIGHHDYYYVDPNFMDVAEAEEHGLLPFGEPSSSRNRESKVTCKKSLTYVLESEDAGLGNALMGLWLSYGLAKKEGRAFFVDDTNW